MGPGLALSAGLAAAARLGEMPRLMRLADGRVRIESLSPGWRVKLIRNEDATVTVDLME